MENPMNKLNGLFFFGGEKKTIFGGPPYLSVTTRVNL